MTDPLPGESGKRIAKDGHEYHVSTTANAKVAPTNQATLVDALDLDGLGPLQAEFLTLIDYEWHLKGDIDIPNFMREYHYTDAEFTKLATSIPIMVKCSKRGIPIHVVNPDAMTKEHASRIKLSPLQLKCANALMDLADTRSIRKKLQDHGATTAQYQAWMRDSIFTGYLRERAESLIGDNQHEAMLALLDKVQKGDIRAIEYYHEITGRFIRQTNNASSTSTHDFQNLVIRIIEIIIDEVDDNEVASRISDRLKGLVAGVQVAQALTADPNGPVGSAIPLPQVATARVITPELEELMHKGMGYDS